MENPIDQVTEAIRDEKERIEEIKRRQAEDPTYGGNNHYQEPQRLDGVPGVLVLISFVVMFLGLAIFAKSEPLIAVICVGQLFFTIGAAVLYSQKLSWDNLPITVFPLAGLGMIVIPAKALYNKKHDLGPVMSTKTVGLLVGLLFFLIGLCVIVFPLIHRNVMLKKCTLKIDATCTGLASRYSRNKNGRAHRVFAPNWEYKVNGLTYEHQESTYTNVGYPEIGSVHEILVNPDDPVEIYRKTGTQAFLVVFGLIFAAMGGFLVFIMMFGI